MLHHTVMYKLKQPVSENAVQLKKRFLEMPVIIDEIKEIKVGIDEFKTDRSFDVCLYIKLDSKEDYDNYKNNPFHLSVADFVKSICERAVAVDYTD